MIWGCITYHGIGTICVVDGNINAEKYISVLDENLWPVILHFQDDNAPVHRARVVQDFRRINQLKSMNWPAQSPDLNIIENCCWHLKRELQKRAANISNVHELQHWTNISSGHIQIWYKSIPRRILRVLRNKGNVAKC